MTMHKSKNHGRFVKLEREVKKLKNNLSANMVKRIFFDILKMKLTTK